MKLHPDDPRLTAHILGELPPDEAAKVERAIAADPALGLAVEEIQSVERLLATTLADGAATLSPRQKGAILAHARAIDAGAPVLQPRRRPARWLAPLAAAAAIVAAIVFLLPDGSPTHPHTAGSSSDDDGATPASILPAPGPVDASAPRRAATPASVSPPRESAGHPELLRRGPVSAAHHPSLPLPVRSGTASYAWISEAILERSSLPTPAAVRCEEILNRFSYRPIGTTAIHQGLTLTAETIRCPWKPSAQLAIITIRGSRETPHEVSTTWHADTANVWRYRLFGHASPAGETARRPLPTTLPTNGEHAVVLEIEPTSGSHDTLGTIEWTVNGTAAPLLTVGTAHADRAPSADARFAAFVCAFSEWLAMPTDENPVSREILNAMAREISADTPAPERLVFLDLVARATTISQPDSAD